MIILWFIATLIFLSGFHFSIFGELCDFDEKISLSAIRVLMSFLIYAITNVYIYHLNRLLEIENKVLFFIQKTILIIFTIGVPIVIFKGSNITSCYFVNNSANLGFLVALLWLLYDKKYNIQNNIVVYYESMLNGKESDLFWNYPPKSVSDIFYQLIVIAFVILIMWLLT